MKKLINPSWIKQSVPSDFFNKLTDMNNSKLIPPRPLPGQDQDLNDMLKLRGK